LKITDVLNKAFRPQETLKKTRIKLYITLALPNCYMAAKLGLIKQGTPEESSRDEINEKNSRVHLHRLQNKCTNCKGVKNNTNFGQITGIQAKLDTTCK